MPKGLKPVELDGRTGEGGGQLVRIAVALASVTGTPVRITHVRGNRAGPRGGGLKSQHVTSIAWLAEATDAEVSGLSVGSATLEFRPRRRPWEWAATCLGADRRVRIVAASAAASALLVLQAVLPFLLFASSESAEGKAEAPIDLEISGGTNVSWSLSYEYLEGVLLPCLKDWFGVRVEPRVEARGWSIGPQSRGCIALRVYPLKHGETLRLVKNPTLGLTAQAFEITSIDAHVLAPAPLHQPLIHALANTGSALETLFPHATLTFATLHPSGHDARIYVLLIAHSAAGALRWGRDWLFAEKRSKDLDALARGIARRVARALASETGGRGVVDEFLQDQLVVFQALAAGRTSFPRGGEDEDILEGIREDGADLRRDKAVEPFGEGSSHTTTARWVTAELLPTVKWFDKGRVCEGAGMVAGPGKGDK